MKFLISLACLLYVWMYNLSALIRRRIDKSACFRRLFVKLCQTLFDLCCKYVLYLQIWLSRKVYTISIRYHKYHIFVSKDLKQQRKIKNKHGQIVTRTQKTIYWYSIRFFFWFCWQNLVHDKIVIVTSHDFFWSTI